MVGGFKTVINLDWKHLRYSVLVFGTSATDHELCGCKFDLLIRYGSDAKDLELSSNKFKKTSVLTSDAISQQCKNLRVNSAILNHLHGLDWRVFLLLTH
ncbi:hypothetical protein [Parasitella parasitica]|uniref:Uncharacterized protein n=1 Tax=Parasitella parasitica TaxID=35722 RepID=A0A0B7N3L1_9FUNG|nr:hypothetical protein [Parasitella parasitica]